MVSVLLTAHAERFSASHMRDFHRISPLGRFDHRVAMSVYISICFPSPFHVIFFEAYFAPTSRSRMSKIFRDSESFGRSAGKKWSQNWTFFLGSGLKLPRKKKFFCVLILPYFAWKNWCGAHLITRVEPILLHALSPKNGGWVQSVHCLRVEPSRGRMDMSTAPFFFFFFF